jgi:hypothetical protein
MRLKHGEDAFASSRSRSFQCSENFGRVVRVIVDKQKALALILDLEPASRVLEFTKRSYDFFERNSKLDRERNDPERIVDIMASGGVEGRFAQPLASTINAKI